MHRSSESIGRMATALAKAQAELNNPERTLTATIQGRDGERTFRYASLATGLDLVRKCLGQHEIAVMQTTTVDHGQILLTTLLVHTSGEWVSSIWPVCGAQEPSAHGKGAALTYARRYALFAMVGIAGEDDLDAPDLVKPDKPAAPEPPSKKSNNGAMHSPRASLPPVQSAMRREELIQELSLPTSEEELARWAYRALPVKNTLSAADSQALELAYRRRAAELVGQELVEGPQEVDLHDDGRPSEPSSVGGKVTSLLKRGRKRSKPHLSFVASQPCTICEAIPCDAHHVKIAQPHSLGRKVSDEFTVPLCRSHHQELHRRGNERTWWANLKIDPLPIARELWEKSPIHAIRAEPSISQQSQP
jgi:ERF superfamily